ncbi:restriction endonuclease subunit S [Macrococcus equipercicus]|uniref:Restriction endonuclease subunit S n=1 Tax=Macrococcus equipercicus TaxID=69967 RepID=A0A9Q9BWA0_9STAP|nr:restriction endonuclease subunit S [Macrococcus equipercicus]UTH14198.1 restriction endonuclease subunit S [Macrococcus equipercicus]
MTNEKRVPELRFPEFSGEWEEKELSKIGSFTKGKLISKSDLSSTGHKCILYGELYTKYGALINEVYSKTELKTKNLVKAQYQDVLIPSSGETSLDIATASSLNTHEEVYLGGDINVITPSKDYNGNFLSLSINGKNKLKLSKYAQGKTVVHLYNSDIKKLRINFPTVEEQKKISEFFSKLDRQIELEEKKLALLEEQKKGYMQKIFSQELRFKDENGEDYPEWEEMTVEQIIRTTSIRNLQISNSSIKKVGKFPVIDQGKEKIVGYSDEENKVFSERKDIIVFGDHTTNLKYIDFPFIVGGDGVKLLFSNVVDMKYLYAILDYNMIEQDGYKRHFSILKTKKLKMSKSYLEQKKIGSFSIIFDRKVINQQYKIEKLNLIKKYFLNTLII